MFILILQYDLIMILDVNLDLINKSKIIKKNIAFLINFFLYSNYYFFTSS